MGVKERSRRGELRRSRNRHGEAADMPRESHRRLRSPKWDLRKEMNEQKSGRDAGVENSSLKKLLSRCNWFKKESWKARESCRAREDITDHNRSQSFYHLTDASIHRPTQSVLRFVFSLFPFSSICCAINGTLHTRQRIRGFRAIHGIWACQKAKLHQ